jgi:hypothetical protein
MESAYTFGCGLFSYRVHEFISQCTLNSNLHSITNTQHMNFQRVKSCFTTAKKIQYCVAIVEPAAL